MRCDDPIFETPLRIPIDQRQVAAQPDFSTALFGHLFPAPLMIFVCTDSAEVNEKLRPRIVEHASRSVGVRKNDAGGRHSKSGQLETCGDPWRRPVRNTYEMADEATRRTVADIPSPPAVSNWTLQAWATGLATSIWRKEPFP
jgi:hypothetical protein